MNKIRLTLLEVVLLVVGILSGLLFLHYRMDLPLTVRIYLKIIPTILMAVWILSRRLTTDNLPLFIGLLLACAGDIVMEIPGIFTLGVVVNMGSLVAYTVYFIKSDHSLDIFRLLPFLVIIAAIYILIFPSLGDYQVPIGIYAVLYIVFLWRSSARIGEPTISPASQWVCFIGCLVITLSDSLLALQLFHFPEHWYTSYGLSMFLWWLGQLMMTITAEIFEKKKRERKAARTA